MNLTTSCFIFLLTMTFAELLNEYNEPGKKLVRKIESTEKKIVNAQLAVAFNKHYQKHSTKYREDTEEVNHC